MDLIHITQLNLLVASISNTLLKFHIFGNGAEHICSHIIGWELTVEIYNVIFSL